MQIEPVPVGQKPANPITCRALREQIETFGKEKWMVTLVPVEGGYTFNAHPIYAFKASRVIQSERSKKVRVFKSIDAALNLARSCGFSSVCVEL